MSSFALQQLLRGQRFQCWRWFGLLGSGAFAQGPQASLSAVRFSSDFAAMAQLKALATRKRQDRNLAPGDGHSARYTSSTPILQKALEAAGLPANQFIITNAQGTRRQS